MAQRTADVWNGNTTSTNSDFVTNTFSDVIDDDKPYVQQQYDVNVGRYKFVAVVVKDTLNEMDRITFGGRKRNCVQYSVYWDDEEKEYPNLDGITYDEKCNINNDFNLERKYGTIRMLQASIRFLCHLYPDTKGIMLKDYSCMKCLDNIRIRLSEFYIAKHGETWYQHKLNAVPYQNPEFHQSLQNLNHKMDESMQSTFKEFYDSHIRGVARGFKKHYSFLKDTYDISKSVRDFVINIHNSGKDCSVFDSWLSHYMSSIGHKELGLEESFFVIGGETIDDWEMPEMRVDNIVLKLNKN
jgi:hypothetical protein